MYEQVFRNRMLFYYPEWDLQRWDERHALTSRNDEKEEARLHKAYDEIFLRRQGADLESLLLLLSRLFPKVAKYAKGRVIGGAGEPRETEADKEKRICHPYYFLIYFSLHVEEGYLGAEELERIIGDANQMQDAGQLEARFTQYLVGLKPFKRYRFFEKIARSEDRLGTTQARALAVAIALSANKLEYDELDIGEFRLAINLVLTLANKFSKTHEITDVLKDVVTRSTTDAFAHRTLAFALNRERNQIFEQWDNVNNIELEQAFLQRLKSRYHKGGGQSIYGTGTNFRDWQALVWWTQHSDKDAEEVTQYLQDEFTRRPASIGKHIYWLWGTASDPEGRKLVNRLFPLPKLAEMAKAQGRAAYSTDSEKKAVGELISGFPLAD